MRPDLAAFLARHNPQAELTEDWGGRFAFRVTGYLTPEIPPLESITSVRALVFWDNVMLCLRDAEGLHLFPGGRREPGETLEETLRREVLEEAGCSLKKVSPLGFMLFHHLNPAPAGYRYPYPNFVQLIYAAEADQAGRGADAIKGDADQYRFRPVAEIQELELSPSQRLYLTAALDSRHART